MAVRTQVYQGLLWQQVMDEMKLQRGARLPPLLLLVLYNGEQTWKAPTRVRDLPGKKLTGKAVYVLTSGQTFSTAEEFSFDLKNLKRATLIGDTTAGGAHPVAPHRIDGHFFIRVPFGRIMDPTTKAGWEGRGVEPDIKVPAEEALDEALKRARASP